MSTLNKLLCGFLAFAALVMFLGWQLALLATDAPLMQDKMCEALAPQTGTDSRTITAAAYGITAFLRGKADTIMTIDQTAPLFNQREMAHLADVRALVSIGRALGWVLMGLLLLVAGIYGMSRYSLISIDWRRLAHSVAAGCFAFFAAAVFVGLWVWLDFDSAFTAFHRLLFVNDLWLLDPRTDLMIRLMPARLFVSYAGTLLMRIAPFYVSVLAASVLAAMTKYQKEGRN